MKIIHQFYSWWKSQFQKQRTIGKVVFGCVTLCFFCFLCSIPISILKPSPPSTLIAKETPSLIAETIPQNIATLPVSKQPTINFIPTTTPKPSCTKLRFAEHLGPDSVDEMLYEGVLFKNVSEIAVRFDCQAINADQITWEWKRDGDMHCTNTFQSNECDQSTIIDWDREPGKFLITLFSKGGYLNGLQSGKYELVIFVSGVEILSGTFEIEN